MFTVTVVTPCCDADRATADRNPAETANASAAPPTRAALLGSFIVPRDVDALMQGLLELGEALIAVGLRLPPHPARVPERAQHAADPGEKRADGCDLVTRHGEV